MSENLEDVKNNVMSDEIELLSENSEKLSILIDNNEDIDKETFETYFLPYILNTIEITDEVTSVFSYNYRKMTKGSFRVPLFVMDDDGSILYKLPPLFLGLDTDESGKISFTKILSGFFRGLENGNLNAGKIFNANLNATTKHLHKDNSQYDFYRGEIQKIYSDYKHLIKDKKLDIKNEEVEDDFLEY